VTESETLTIALHCCSCVAEEEQLRLQRERADLLQQIVVQEQNQVDGAKLNNARAALEQNLSQLIQRREAADRQRWDIEKDLNKQLEELEEAIDSYRSLATQYKFIPSSSKHVDGIELDIEFNLHALQESNAECQRLSTNIKSHVKVLWLHSCNELLELC
jgi:SMC interacting uncharacterized protein involved in chromosome segregation